NRFIYDDQTSLLHPRAISYSAGLIDYFFRGKIDFVTDDAMPGHYKIKNLGEERMTGRFALYYDDADGIRRPTPNVWMLDIPAQGESESLTVQPNTDSEMPPESLDGYVLVFNGDMGEEKQAPGSVGAVTGKVIEDPLEIKFTRVAYFYSPPSGPGGTPFSELLASVELPLAENGDTPKLIEVIRAGKHDMHVKFKSARGEETFPCINYSFYGADNINQFCYNHRDPSININFNFEDRSYGDNSNSFLKPFFDYNSFGVGDEAAEMTFYIGDAVLFSFRFDPETVADFSPVTFSKKFHVNTKKQVNLLPGQRF
ncbi:MAG: hypothetical protein JNM52_06990, partial [Betaproteobacteria bacterium]|nr:hypothetical protein [Betaproteobacteria bacterium]